MKRDIETYKRQVEPNDTAEAANPKRQALRQRHKPCSQN
jgi:hypothetical protein